MMAVVGGTSRSKGRKEALLSQVCQMFAFMISFLKKRSLISDIWKIRSLPALSFVSVVYQCTSPLEFFVCFKAIILPAVKQGWVDRGGKCFWLESETSFSFRGRLWHCVSVCFAKLFWKLRACPRMKVGSQVLSKLFCAMGAFAKGAKMLCKGISGCTKWSHWSHSSAVSHLQCLIKKPGRCVGRWARQILSSFDSGNLTVVSIYRSYSLQPSFAIKHIACRSATDPPRSSLICVFRKFVY